MSKANDVQHGGEHYKNQAIQVWDYITSNGIPYLEGNAIKYLSRWRAKGGLQDLLKAKHYVEKLIEVATAEAAKVPEIQAKLPETNWEYTTTTCPLCGDPECGRTKACRPGDKA